MKVICLKKHSNRDTSYAHTQNNQR